jgi:hypothetical protein
MTAYSKVRRRPDRAVKGYRSAGSARFSGQQTRTARARAVDGASTVYIDLMAERTGVDGATAYKLVRINAELMSGTIDGDGTSRIKQETAASRLGMSDRHMRRGVRVMKDHAVLVVHSAPHRPREDEPGRWETTGPNGYELSPAFLAELDARLEAARAKQAKGANGPRPSKANVYREDTHVLSVSSRLRPPAGQPGRAGLKDHAYADDDGLGWCQRCQLPASNASHRRAA